MENSADLDKTASPRSKLSMFVPILEGKGTSLRMSGVIELTASWPQKYVYSTYKRCKQSVVGLSFLQVTHQ